MVHGSKRGLLIGAAIPVLLFSAEPALARAPDAIPSASEDPAPDATGQEDNGDIVVTAQRREQRLVDAPVPVTVLSGKTLEQYRIQGMGELSLYTPGLLIQEQSVQRSGFNLRGITQDDSSPVSEPAISIFVDGIDNSRQGGAISELIDIDRAQVIRGPQGTLFGRGSVVGVLSLETRRPTNEFEGSISAEVGELDLFNVTGVLNAPLVDDKVAFRTAWRFKKRNGDVENVARPGTTLNGIDTVYGRATLRFTPTANFTSDVIFSYQEDHPPATQFKSIVVPPKGGDVSPFTPAALDRPDAGIDRTVYGVTLDNRLTLSPTLELRSFTGYRHVEAAERWDGDGTGYAYIIGNQYTTQKQYSEELRVSWTPDRSFSVIAGGSWFHELVNDDIALGLNEQYVLGSFPTITAPTKPIVATTSLAGKPVTTMNINDNFRNNDRTSWSGYVNVSKMFWDRFTIDAGLRYTRDDATTHAAASTRSLDGVAPIALPFGLFGSTGGVFYTAERPFSFWTPRVALSYKITPDVNVYAGVSRGTRSGVVDATYSRTSIARPVFNYVLPETVWNYEAGIKAKIGRINADITAYKYDYTNLQIRDPSSILGALTNAGKASGKGIEASVRGPVAPGLDVIASYAYQDAHYDLFFDSTGKNLAGNVFRLSPKHKASLAANYDFDLSDTLKGHVRVTEFYQSKTFFNADNLPYESQGGYALTNLGIGILDSHQGWSVEVFGNNLFDKNYLLDLGNTGKSFGLPTAIRGEPRVIGIRVQQNF